MAWANSSLPVPLSPRMRVVMLLCEATLLSSMAYCRLGDSPMMLETV